MEHSLPEVLAGALTGRYRIEREIGAGGMALVFRAHDVRHDRPVAIKVLRPELAQSIGTDRFIREIRVAARLTHPLIVPLFDSGRAGGFLFYVMPLLTGESLRDRFRRTPQLPEADVVSLARDVAAALDHAHRADIVHRDIKPENILLHEGHALVTDFGIGKALSAAAAPDSLATGAGIILGTPAYMSPEQAAGDSMIDGRSDLYSLGCTLFEALSGQLPFPGIDAQTMVASRFTMPALDVRTIRPEVSDGLARLITRLLAFAPGDRPATAAQFLDELRDSVPGRRGPAESVSVAVLPFANLSGAVADEYLSDGMTEEIIDALVRLPGLRVAPRTSAFAFKGRADDLRTIAARLGVGHVLEGSVRKSGERLRINVKLIDAATSEHLWSERFDRELTDVFAVQDEIASAIARALQVHLARGSAPIVRPPTTSLEAWDLYLRGRFFWSRRGSGIERGLEYFQAALERDPAFALAWAGVADACTLQAYYGYRAPREAVPRALEAARRALELEPGLAEAHSSIGFIQLCFEGDVAAAERELELAVRLKPALVVARNWHALCAAARDDIATAIARDEAALSLEPLSVFTNTHLGWMLLLDSRLGVARERLEQALELDPTFAMARWLHAHVLLAQGERELSIEQFRRAAAESGLASMRASLGTALAICGDTLAATTIAEELVARAEHEYVHRYPVAVLLAHLGDLERATLLREQAIAAQDPNVPFARARHQLETLKWRDLEFRT